MLESSFRAAMPPSLVLALNFSFHVHPSQASNAIRVCKSTDTSIFAINAIRISYEKSELQLSTAGIILKAKLDYVYIYLNGPREINSL